MLTPADYQFGPFRYDPAERVLYRDGVPVPLVPKAVDTLHALIENRGRVMERPELMRLIWPDAKVEETGLARNISILRKALGDEGDEPLYIETLPRRGYRFIARPEAPVEKSRRKWPWAAAVCLIAGGSFLWWQFYLPSRYLGSARVSLAVVPFECRTASAECTRFASAFEDQLINRLTESGGIHVIAPSTVRRHRSVGVSMGLMGRLLGLDVLVEGSVESPAGDTRVTTRLVDVHTGRLIWAQDRHYPAGDGAADSRAAREVAAELAAHLWLR